MTSQDLAGTIAVVTGAGSLSDQAVGMGTVIVQHLLDGGAIVAGLDWNAEGLDRVAAAHPSEVQSGRFLPVRCDVSSRTDCAAAVDRVIAEIGTPTVLFNHAGIGESDLGQAGLTRFWETDYERWELVQRVNVFGPFVLARLLLPGMLANKWGRIINTSTSFQTMMDKFRSGYGPSKAALEAHSAIWAKELKDTGVTVNCLLPGGMVATNATARLGVDLSKLLKAEIMGPPAAWLASRQSDGVTGRRFVAREWDTALEPSDAAARQQYPIAWPDLGPGRTVDPLLGT
jgi:NAD(P)-dependent dehydrogenase (short-subunit alcohol dehydrogenase family)